MIAQACAVVARRTLQFSASRIVTPQFQRNVARSLIVPSFPRLMPIKTVDVSNSCCYTIRYEHGRLLELRPQDDVKIFCHSRSNES
jgi:hypothetical protein